MKVQVTCTVCEKPFYVERPEAVPGQPLSISFHSVDRPEDGVNIHTEVYVCSASCKTELEERILGAQDV